MHDLDQIKLELEPEDGIYDASELELYEQANGFDDGDTELGDMEEMELATELLAVTSDAELEQFLGKLMRKARRAVGGRAGAMLGGLLKQAARKVLPMAGGAVGTMIGGPFGTAIGSQLAGQASRVLGLELEGLSPQDQEYEVARSFVRLANSAVNTLAKNANGSSADPVGSARSAMIEAAKKHAPGLLRHAGRTANAIAAGARNDLDRVVDAAEDALRDVTGSGLTSGRWVRHGNKIILFGV